MKNIYDENICKLFKSAENEKTFFKSEYVGTSHLLLAILKTKSSLTDYLKNYNLTYERFAKYYKDINDIGEKNNVMIYTPVLKKVILNAKENISYENLLLNILNEVDSVAVRILINMDIDVDSIYNYLKNGSHKEDLFTFKYGKILNETVNFNEKVIGREKEINLILETLLRKKKNNPLLIGDAGVGKSAIVEEIARKICKNELGKEFSSFIIVSLSMGSLLSNTKYRGQFEERINKIIDEVQNNKNIILFIDEIHLVANAGAAEGAISAGDLLKPILARGDIKIIGATTKKEYEKYIEKDSALSRRFEKIYISEPNENETIDILLKIKSEYTHFHSVNISDDNIKFLVHLANVYFPNKKNPDKAIELLDSTLSYVKLNNSSKLIKSLEDNLKQIENKKILSLENGNFKEALSKSKEEKSILKDLKLIKSGRTIFAQKEDIFKMLELKDNIYSKEKIVKLLNLGLKNKYSKPLVNKIINSINEDKISIINVSGNYKNIVNDIASSLKYNIITPSSLDNFITKIKYNTNNLFVINSDSIINFINKSLSDGKCEYNNEYVSLNNAIIVNVNNNFGFIKSKNENVICL